MHALLDVMCAHWKSVIVACQLLKYVAHSCVIVHENMFILCFMQFKVNVNYFTKFCWELCVYFVVSSVHVICILIVFDCFVLSAKYSVVMFTCLECSPTSHSPPSPSLRTCVYHGNWCLYVLFDVLLSTHVQIYR